MRKLEGKRPLGRPRHSERKLKSILQWCAKVLMEFVWFRIGISRKLL
jgi:hypothetical protein